jgi:hypothetical protein
MGQTSKVWQKGIPKVILGFMVIFLCNKTIIHDEHQPSLDFIDLGEVFKDHQRHKL